MKYIKEYSEYEDMEDFSTDDMSDDEVFRKFLNDHTILELAYFEKDSVEYEQLLYDLGYPEDYIMKKRDTTDEFDFPYLEFDIQKEKKEFVLKYMIFMTNVDTLSPAFLDRVHSRYYTYILREFGKLLHNDKLINRYRIIIGHMSANGYFYFLEKLINDKHISSVFDWFADFYGDPDKYGKDSMMLSDLLKKNLKVMKNVNSVYELVLTGREKYTGGDHNIDAFLRILFRNDEDIASNMKKGSGFVDFLVADDKSYNAIIDDIPNSIKHAVAAKQNKEKNLDFF